jgi:hypothetical protein
MLDKSVETAPDELYKFGTELAVEIGARCNSREVNDDMQQHFRFVDITHLSATYDQDKQKVVFLVIAKFEYENKNNYETKTIRVLEKFDILQVEKCALEIIESSNIEFSNLQRSNDTHDEFDDFKIQRDKKEELK